MEFINSTISIFAIYVSIIIMDYLWLGIITKSFIISQFGSLVKVEEGSIKINLVVGLIAWFVIALGCYIFAVHSGTSLSNVLTMGVIFGFISYSIYDLTNLTFITNYPLKFVFVDIAWGTFLCGSISGIGFLVKNFVGKIS